MLSSLKHENGTAARAATMRTNWYENTSNLNLNFIFINIVTLKLKCVSVVLAMTFIDQMCIKCEKFLHN